MADWYVSSAVYAAMAQWAASTAYTVGQIIRPTAPVFTSQYVYRCTVAGTSGGTQPAWGGATGNNITITDGGVTWTNVTGQSAYGWSAAAGNLFSITLNSPGGTRAVVGDRFFLSSDHSESSTSIATYTLANTTVYGQVQAISVNRAGSVPPAVGDIQSGAAISNSSQIILDAFSNQYWQGITFTISGTAVVFSLNNGGSKTNYLKNCTLVLAAAGSTSRISSNSTAKAVFDNTVVQFSNATQYIGSTGYPFELLWINTPSAIQGSAIPTTLFQCSTYLANQITCRGVDLSAVTGTLIADYANGCMSKLLLDSCRIAPGVTRYATPGINGAGQAEVELVNCYDGTNVINERYTPAGAITADRATYLTSGAQDDIGNYALKLASSSRSDFQTMALDCFAFDVENTVTGAAKTATVEVVSSASLNNNDIRLLLEYMGGTSTTWSPADKANMTLSNGNLTTTSTGTAGGVRAAPALTAGKWYWEITMIQWTAAASGFGISSGTANIATPSSDSTQHAEYLDNGYVWINNVNVASLGGHGGNPLVCVAVDTVAKLIWFRITSTGNWNGSSSNNPATGVGGYDISPLVAPLYPMFGAAATAGESCTANFGATAFAGAVPSGFSALPVATTNPIASFADSLPSVLTAASALPTSSNTWTGPSSTTWNPGDIQNNAVTLSNGNLTATSINAGPVRGLTGFSSGKFYWEVTWTTVANINSGIGIANLSYIYSGGQGISNPAATGTAGVNTNAGSFYANGASASVNVGAISSGNLVCFAVDLTAKLFWIRVGASGNWNGSSSNNPATGVGGVNISSIATGPLFPLFFPFSTGEVCTANFGASAFSGAVPSGFTSGWSGLPTTKQLLQCTFTPQRAGRVRGLVRLGKPSTTCWVNPQIAIT